MPPIVVGTSNIRTDRTNPASTASMATSRMSTGVRGITIQKIPSSASTIFVPGNADGVVNIDVVDFQVPLGIPSP